jgi:SAM-dependent methyltransferase
LAAGPPGRIGHTSGVVESGWTWDPSLYSGSAAYYSRGRVAYPQELVDRLAAQLGLDGTGRLLDVGCGPGSLTLPLAGRFERAVGLDADPDMLAEAARRARAAGIDNAEWVQRRAEDLPGPLGRFRVITFAQSFHWLDRPRVARVVRGMLDPGGVCVHVGATTHQGIESDVELAHPRPPRPAIEALIARYLGAQRRAGRGILPAGRAGGEDAVYRAAGFAGPTRIEIAGRHVVRSADDIVAGVFSLSSSTPHLFGERGPAFADELHELLRAASPTGQFSEQIREIAVDIWRPDSATGLTPASGENGPDLDSAEGC